MTISSYEYEENDLTEEETVEDSLFRGQLASAASSALSAVWIGALVAF